MKKILLILSLFPILVFSQKSYKIPADSTILNNIGSGKNELVIRNATSNITGGVLTNLGNGVTAFVLGGGSARVVDTIYKNNTKDSIVFTISGIRYAVKDSFNLNTDSQTLSISNDTLTISGGNTVVLNRKVDTSYSFRNASLDSICQIVIINGNSTRSCIKESTGGGSPAGSDTWIQYNNAGAFGASSDLTFDPATSTLTTTNNWEAFRTSIKFASGGGTNDLTASAVNDFTGTPPTTFIVLAYGNIQIVDYINLVGGNFSQGDTITGSVSGAEGYVAYDDGVGQFYVSITNSIQFAATDVIDNANGVTADYDTSTTSDDIFFWYSTNGGSGGPIVITGTAQTLNDGIDITFGSTTGHGAEDSWDWSYKTLKNTVLSNRKIGSGIFGGAINGSYFKSGSGSSTIQAMNGFFQNGNDDRIFSLSAYEDLTSGNNSDKERAYYGFNPFKNQPTNPLEFIVYMRKGVGFGPFTPDITEFNANTVEGFRMETNKSILMSSPLFTVSDQTFSWVGGTNSTGITIDDVNKQIKISGFPTGITGNADYSANITDLDYTQKIYVDQRISDTATQIRSEIADTASSLHTLIDAKVSTTTLTDSLDKKTNKLISFNAYTTSDTLRLTDADKVIEMNVGTANNLVIPTNTAYAFPVGTQIVLIQIGAGQTTFVPASGVTVHSSGSKTKLTGQYSGATIIKKATNEWYLFGDITN